MAQRVLPSCPRHILPPHPILHRPTSLQLAPLIRRHLPKLFPRRQARAQAWGQRRLLCSLRRCGRHRLRRPLRASLVLLQLHSQLRKHQLQHRKPTCWSRRRPSLLQALRTLSALRPSASLSKRRSHLRQPRHRALNVSTPPIHTTAQGPRRARRPQLPSNGRTSQIPRLPSKCCFILLRYMLLTVGPSRTRARMKWANDIAPKDHRGWADYTPWITSPAGQSTLAVSCV